MIMLPRRDRLNALALEVTHGSLLLRSGWLTSEEQAEVDCLAARGQHLDPPASTDMLGEVTQLHRILLAVVKRVEALEATLPGLAGPGRRPEVTVRLASSMTLGNLCRVQRLGRETLGKAPPLWRVSLLARSRRWSARPVSVAR